MPKTQKDLKLNEKKTVDATTEKTEMLELSEKDFKAATVKMLQ